MNSIKMIVTDLDGTLLHTNGTISVKTIDVLRQCQKQGILVVLATARFWIGAEKYINFIKPDYVISADGSVMHNREKLIDRYSFDVETTNLIIQSILEVNSNAEILALIDKRVYWNNEYISESERLFKAQYFNYKNPLSDGANKIATMLPDKEMADKIAKECGCKVIHYRDENVYSFVPLHAGKRNMIRKLADRLDISLEEIVTFGDDENDIEMLKECGLGIAVANALPEVKEIADEITLSNDEDGVASFIANKILN